MTARLRRAPAGLLAAALAAVYLVIAPQSPDLAAAAYRSDLFGRQGLSIWDNSWYGGHHLIAYSLLAPGLGWLITPRLLAALSMVALVALFERLIAGRFGARPERVAALWLAVGAGINLLSSRVAFDLGLAIGMAALLAGVHRRMWAALALSLLCTLASPVAGAFLALAWLAWSLAGPARAWPAALTVAALAPIGALTLAFPEGGTQPFVGSAFWPALLGAVVVGALIPAERRTLRIGAVLYAGALAGSFILPTAVGGNAERLGALFAGPVAALMLARGASPRARPAVLLMLAPFLLYWQANAPVADYASTLGNPTVQASYYTPLLDELARLDVGYGRRPARIEVVPTAVHWESRWVAAHVMIARGWERQLDRLRDPEFYREPEALTAALYHEWLLANAVSYVALPDSHIDYSSLQEAALLRGPTPGYLREVWSSAHWRLFAVQHPTPLAAAPAQLLSAGVESMSLAAPAAGTYLVRIRFTPYWKVHGAGCVKRAPDGWTDVVADAPGTVEVGISFSLARIFEHGPRCG